MKYFKALICAVLISALLSGCSFRISSSIDDLISPLSPFGENADVKEALDRYAANGYSLKMPNYGNNISSYNFCDIDGDGSQEAVAFYEPSDKLGTISLALIKHIGDEWNVICNIPGIGRDVHSLDFAELNGKGNKELVVCWDAISNSSNHELAVYEFISGKKPKLQMINETVSVNTCYITDIFNNGKNKLLLFTVNSGSSSSPKAELFSVTSSGLSSHGYTKLDSRIASFISIKSEIADGKVRIYADALSSDASLVITEIIRWSDSYSSIESPFYDYGTARTEETSRKAIIPSMDVDGDKLFEIPIDYSIKKLPKNINAVEFMNFRYSTLIHNSYALVSGNDKYVLMIPDEYIDAVSVKYSDKNRELTVINKSTNKAAFSVMPVLKATYSEEKYNGYSKILEASGYCYLAKLGNDESFKISLDEIKNFIKSIE